MEEKNIDAAYGYDEDLTVSAIIRQGRRTTAGPVNTV